MNPIEKIKDVTDLFHAFEQKRSQDVLLVNPDDRFEVKGYIAPTRTKDGSISLRIVESPDTPCNLPNYAWNVVSSSVIARVPSASDEDRYGVPAGSGLLISGNIPGCCDDWLSWPDGQTLRLHDNSGTVSYHKPRNPIEGFAFYLRPDDPGKAVKVKIAKGKSLSFDRIFIAGRINTIREEESKRESLEQGRTKLSNGEMPSRLNASLRRAYPGLDKAGFFHQEKVMGAIANGMRNLGRSISYNHLIDKYGSGLWDEVGMIVGFLAHYYGFDESAKEDNLRNNGPVFIRRDGEYRWLLQYEDHGLPREMLASLTGHVRDAELSKMELWVDEVSQASGCQLRAVWNIPRDENSSIHASLTCGGANRRQIGNMMGDAPVSLTGDVIVAMYPVNYGFRGRDRELNRRGCIYSGCGKCQTESGGTVVLSSGASAYLTN